jgi:molybdopterin-guanine dinucleotide biosynthesis protein B
MPPIVSVVGKSDSGKTSLIVELLQEFRERGYRVAVIKHAAEEVELDTVNKDSWRFSRAGGAVSAVNSGDNLAAFRTLEGERDPLKLGMSVGADCDLILTEGFKGSHYPKIEVHRHAQGPEVLSPPGELLAVVTDEPLPVDLPRFSRDEASRIVDLIIEEVLGPAKHNTVEMSVNDSPVPLDSGAQDLMARTLLAMAAGLNGGSGIENLRVSVRRRT